MMASRIEATLFKMLSAGFAKTLSNLNLMVIFFILTTFSFATAERTQIESLARKKAKSAIGNLSKEEIRDYYHKYHKRTPRKSPIAKYSKSPSRPSINQKRLAKYAAPRSLPENMIFPGEFEEIQAVTISWPYMFFDSKGEEEALQVFKNVGLLNLTFPDSVEEYLDNLPDNIKNDDEKMYNIFDSLAIIYHPGKNLGFQEVISQPDVSSESEMAILYAELAKAIDDNVEVWIRIENSADSTEIINFLAQNNITLSRVKFLPYPGNDFWTRDYGPVGFYYGPQDSIGLIDFEYMGGRPLDDSLPIYISQNTGYPVFTTSIEFEGGNLLLDGYGNLITTDFIDTTNGDDLGQDVFEGIDRGEYVIYPKTKEKLSPQQVRDSLKLWLNLDTLIVLPSLKFDGGSRHIDLYADLWDENTFVFTQMPPEMSSLSDFNTIEKNVSTIMGFHKSDGSSFKKSAIPLPRKDDGSWYANDSDYDKVHRSYSNHLIINKTIIQPVYANGESGDITNLQKDLDSLKSQYPGYKIVPIYAKILDGMGGSIHCMTKQIPADNPLRIIHLPVEKNNVYKSSYPVSAKVHNRSGIAKTVCKWRYKGAANWNSAQLTSSNSTDFRGAIDNGRRDGIIEYYLEAESKNGKTMTKPMTAPEGYYTFKFGNTDVFNLDTKHNNAKKIEIIQKPLLKKVYINTAQLNSDFNVQLLNPAGKAVYSRDFTGKSAGGLVEINTNSMSSGIFIAVVQSKDGYVHKEKLTIKIAPF